MANVARKNPGNFPKYLPTARFKVVLQEALAKMVLLSNNPFEYGITQLARQIGIGERRIRGILDEEFATILFETADRILIGLGKEYYWHLSPEQGGFADWYEADVLPELPPPTARQLEILNTQRARKNLSMQRRGVTT